MPRLLDKDGDFLLSALVLELSFNARDVGVESTKFPFITLLGVEWATVSLISDLRLDCTNLDASPVAGVGAIEEVGPECGSAIVDADPWGSSSNRLCPDGVDDRVAAPERPDTCRCMRCW